MKEDLKTARSFAMGELTLRPFAGQNLMVVRVEGKAGTVAPSHSHPHEQMTLVERGAVRLKVDGQPVEAGTGELVHIPSGAEHEAELLEDSVFYDIFHPVREEFLRKVEEESV